MPDLTIIELPVGALVDYANNSKEHDRANVDAIKASIEAFGMCDPVGVWRNPEGEYEIVEGHGRKMALQELGHDTVPCIDLSHLTDEERRVYSHVHNQTALMGDLDLEIAELDFDGTEFDAIPDDDFDETGLDAEPKDKSRRVRVSILFDCKPDYDAAHEAIDNLAEQYGATVSVAME